MARSGPIAHLCKAPSQTFREPLAPKDTSYLRVMEGFCFMLGGGVSLGNAK